MSVLSESILASQAAPLRDYDTSGSVALGAALQALRLSRGLSISRAAREAGLDHSYLSRVERGRRGITAHRLDDLLAVLEPTADQRDRILALAGHPSDLVRVFQCWPALADVAAVLLDDAIIEADKDALMARIALELQEVRRGA